MQTQTPELEEGGSGRKEGGRGEAPPFTTMPDHPNTPGIFCSQLKPQTNIRLARSDGEHRPEPGRGGGGGKEQGEGEGGGEGWQVPNRAATSGAGPAPS